LISVVVAELSDGRFVGVFARSYNNEQPAGDIVVVLD